jgi:hypothetical protein
MDAVNLLAQIEAAIEALLTSGAQSYSIGSRSVTKLDLAKLFEERRMLQTEVERSQGSGGFTLAKLGRRR